MRVRCIKLLNSVGEPRARSSRIKVGADYHVLAIELGSAGTMFRIDGEDPMTPFLAQPEMFEVISGSIPDNWVISAVKPGCLELGPASWMRRGFGRSLRPRVSKCGGMS